MPSDAAAVKWQAQITERQVQRMALQVMDQKSMACHSQAFAGKADDLRGLQMMQKKGAAYGVKTIVAEGKCQRVAADSRMARAEVRWSEVQDDWPRSDSRSDQ